MYVELSSKMKIKNCDIVEEFITNMSIWQVTKKTNIWENSVEFNTLVFMKKRKKFKILYFVDRASRYKFLVITNLTQFFMYLFIYLFISCLYMFRASQRSSSADRIVLIHHPVWLVGVSDCLVCLTGIPSSHSHWLIIPDDVLIQFDLLMMSAVTPETCRDMK